MIQIGIDDLSSQLLSRAINTWNADAMTDQGVKSSIEDTSFVLVLTSLSKTPFSRYLTSLIQKWTWMIVESDLS